MTYEKPWLDLYSRLLTDLTSTLGGRIEVPKYSDEAIKNFSHAWSGDTAYYLYDIYHCELNGVQLQLEISHQAMAGDTSIDDEGMVEFLVFSASVRPQGNFRIRPEGVFDRFRKALKLHWEFETGNPTFDRAFNLEVPDDRAKPGLRRPEVMDTITALLPFEYLQAHPGGFRCSELLSEDEQLSREHVTDQLQLMVTLASYLRQ